MVHRTERTDRKLQPERILDYGSRRAGLLKSAQGADGWWICVRLRDAAFPGPSVRGPGRAGTGDGLCRGLGRRTEEPAGTGRRSECDRWAGVEVFRERVFPRLRYNENHDNQDDGPTACRMPIEFLAAVLAHRTARPTRRWLD